MGLQFFLMSMFDYEVVGWYVWELVLVNYQRFNIVSEGCKVVMIGELNWYGMVVYFIWGVVKFIVMLVLRMIVKFCFKGVDIVVISSKVLVLFCGLGNCFEFDVLDDYEYVGLKNVGE